MPLLYLLQVSACTGIFYLFYRGVLSRLTFFSIARWYLLVSLLLSFVIPCIPVPAGNTGTMRVSRYLSLAEGGRDVNRPEILQGINGSDAAGSFSLVDLANAAYIVIAVILFIKLFMSLLVLRRRLRSAKVFWLGGVKILEGSGRLSNGSFLGFIFIDREARNENELWSILVHEMAHVKLFHSFDKLLAQLVQVILWFNPFSYLYTKAIAENHEFEVDQVVTKESDKAVYAELVVLLGRQGNGPAVNDFSMAPVKRRIVTLFKQPSSNMKKINYVLVLPLAALTVLAFGNKTVKTPAVLGKDVLGGSLASSALPADTVPEIRLYPRKQVKERADLLPVYPENGSVSAIGGDLKYSADSIRFSKDGQLIYLYGKAVLEFMKGLTLVKMEAANIRIDRNKLVVSGKGEHLDAGAGKYKGKAKMSFLQMPDDKSTREDASAEKQKADEQLMEADSITFSLRSLKGKAVGK